MTAETLRPMVAMVERPPRRQEATVVRRLQRPGVMAAHRHRQLVAMGVAVLQLLLSMAAAIRGARNLKAILTTVAIHRAATTQTMARHPTPLMAAVVVDHPAVTAIKVITGTMVVTAVMVTTTVSMVVVMMVGITTTVMATTQTIPILAIRGRVVGVTAQAVAIMTMATVMMSVITILAIRAKVVVDTVPVTITARANPW